MGTGQRSGNHVASVPATSPPSPLPEAGRGSLSFAQPLRWRRRPSARGMPHGA
jgi:hypothetical protein